MTCIREFINRNLFSPQPPKASKAPNDENDTFLDYLVQKPKVKETTFSPTENTRHPSSLYARAVMWEATSTWLNPLNEEVKLDKSKFKPLKAAARVTARVIYCTFVPTLAGIAGVVYHPVKGFYQLCLAGLYKIKSIKSSDDAMNKIAKDALTLAGVHGQAFLYDFVFTLIYTPIIFLFGPISAFKHSGCSYLNLVAEGAFSDRDDHFKAIAQARLQLRAQEYSNPLGG
jgi:hypothetical protein